jgi:MOSC domain-containing protein YiiM
VFSINCSEGGVPKLPVPEALITREGLLGDSQRNRKHHGGPERAVCLYSSERIRALQEEGHPISTGSTGENLTILGIDWDLVAPQCVIDVGDAILEVTSFTKPCKTIRESFIDQHFVRLSQKHYPGWSRVYARVLKEWLVRVGDRVSISPEGGQRKGWLQTLLS